MSNYFLLIKNTSTYKLVSVWEHVPNSDLFKRLKSMMY